MVASQQEIIDSTQGSSVSIGVFTNLSTWDAISNQSWLTVTKSISKGTITAIANTKNPEPDSRSATITLSGIGADDVIITIIQLGSSGKVGIFDAVLTNSLKIYPNPYKSHTNILYELSTNSTVNIEVYNIVGKKVCELVNEFQKTGKYSYQFNSGTFGYSAGIYFLRFEVNGIVLTRKLIDMR